MRGGVVHVKRLLTTMKSDTRKLTVDSDVLAADGDPAAPNKSRCCLPVPPSAACSFKHCFTAVVLGLGGQEGANMLVGACGGISVGVIVGTLATQSAPVSASLKLMLLVFGLSTALAAICATLFLAAATRQPRQQVQDTRQAKDIISAGWQPAQNKVDLHNCGRPPVVLHGSVSCASGRSPNSRHVARSSASNSLALAKQLLCSTTSARGASPAESEHDGMACMPTLRPLARTCTPAGLPGTSAYIELPQPPEQADEEELRMDSYQSSCGYSSVDRVRSSFELRRLTGLPATFSPWRLDTQDVQICRDPDTGKELVLGSGGFGEVYLALLRGVIPCAVKRQKIGSGSDKDHFMREIDLLKSLSNMNIVQFQGAIMRENEVLLVTEHMEGGSLYDVIQRRAISWHHKGCSIALDAARGLHYLHSTGVIHNDIKSPNILLTKHGIAKLADVGLARVQDVPADVHSMAQIGTLAWAAPELLKGQGCDEKADIFSFGVVLWEIVTGEAPVRGRMREVRVPQECPQEVAHLIDSCTEVEPELRPTAQEVCTVLRKAKYTRSQSQTARSTALRRAKMEHALRQQLLQQGIATDVTIVGSAHSSQSSKSATKDRYLASQQEFINHLARARPRLLRANRNGVEQEDGGFQPTRGRSLPIDSVRDFGEQWQGRLTKLRSCALPVGAWQLANPDAHPPVRHGD